MMALVMAGGDGPAAQRPLGPPARKHFPAHMVGDAHQRHDAQHQTQHRDMDRHQEHQRRDHHRAGQRLDRVEAHRRPGGWRAAVMMHGMGDPEPFGLMHPAMRPVKPCVMREQIDEQRYRQIPERIGCHIAIDRGPSAFLPAPHHHARRDAIDGSAIERPAHLPPHLRAHAMVQTGPHALGQPGEGAAGGQIAQAHDQRHRQRGGDQGEDQRRHCGSPYAIDLNGS